MQMFRYNSSDEAMTKPDGICVLSVLLHIDDEYPNPEIEKVSDKKSHAVFFHEQRRICF